MKCLDSDLLVAILRGEKDAQQMALELDAQGRNATTTINAFEIFYGANHSSRRAENLREVRKLLGRLDVIPFDLRSSEKAGEVLADLAERGEMIEFRDAMVAGIALESGLTLVTRNKRHFAKIDRLRLETW